MEQGGPRIARVGFKPGVRAGGEAPRTARLGRPGGLLTALPHTIICNVHLKEDNVDVSLSTNFADNRT